MKQFIALAPLLLITLATPALADMHCRPQANGDVLCRGTDGSIWRGDIDSHQNEVWHDTKGNTITGRTDRYHNVHYQSSRGPNWKKGTYLNGQEEWHSSSGKHVIVTRPDKDTWVYTDHRRNTLTCKRDVFREIYCREKAIDATFPLPQLIPLRR